MMIDVVLWAVLVAVTLLAEFFTTDFCAACFSLGGLVALILAACGVSLYWQIPFFIVVSLLAIVFARPLLKKWLIKKTIPTNLDQYFGKQVKLLSDVVDGQSQIKINDVIWTAVCEPADLKKDNLVVIERAEGNKIIVKGVK